jgi:hypothetical protein
VLWKHVNRNVEQSIAHGRRLVVIAEIKGKYDRIQVIGRRNIRPSWHSHDAQTGGGK